jgi:hypothetical protein
MKEVEDGVIKQGVLSMDSDWITRYQSMGRITAAQGVTNGSLV